VNGLLVQTGAPRAEVRPAVAPAVEEPMMLAEAAPRIGLAPEVTARAEAERLAEGMPPLMMAAEAAAPEEGQAAAVAVEADLGVTEKRVAPLAQPFETPIIEDEEAPAQPALDTPLPRAAPAPGAAAVTGVRGEAPALQLADQGGLALPVRQLEIGFGAAAALLGVGAWLLLRRRARRP